MIWCYLQVATERLISVDEVLYWVGAAIAIITLATAIVVPLRRMLNKYNTQLKETQDFMQSQAELNERYRVLLCESERDRQKLNEDIAAIKTATLTQIKLEINKVANRAIERGYVYAWECDMVEILYEAYVPLGGNSNTGEKMTRLRALKISYDQSEEDYERRR